MIITKWTCERCSVRNEREMKKTQCVFCTNTKGITTKLLREYWAHISCIRWIFFIYPKDMNKAFDYLSVLPSWRMLNSCDLCSSENIDPQKLKNKCILKCYDNECYFYMHVNCAMEYNCIFRYSEMEKYNEKYKYIYIIKIEEGYSSLLSKT
jgi:hypothetical protein